jgi:dTDP-4-dehydrorhamnose 3,5-epimerase
MYFKKLAFGNSWEIDLEDHVDSRGLFREVFSSSEINRETGLSFDPVQQNFSVSSKGVLRGIHFSLAPEGQQKWITCLSGSIIDCIVDLRENSPNFGEHVLLLLDSKRPKALLIGEGMGHAFLSLEENTSVNYLLSSPYRSELEFGINPFDAELAIEWPEMDYILSKKDEIAPELSSYKRTGKLPQNL